MTKLEISPQPPQESESKMFLRRIEDGATHLLGLFDVLIMLSERGDEHANLLTLLAKDCATEATLLGDVAVFLRAQARH